MPQSCFVETPAQRINPVLTEKWFSIENHRRHAPMSRLFQKLMVFRNLGFGVILLESSFHFSQVQTGFCGGQGQMVTFVPILRPSPQQGCHMEREIDAPSTSFCLNAKPG